MARVIHIKSDDVGYGDIACYGHPDIITPNIDSLATNGCKFNRFYVANPICSPSRAAFLTGRPGQFSRVFHADLLTSGVFSDKCWLPPGTTTVAHWCRLQGASTGIYGKWHLGHPGAGRGAGMPTIHGFDEWSIHPYLWETLWQENGGSSLAYNERPWIDQNFPTPACAVETGEISDLTAEKAIAFIQRHSANPDGFYLHVEFFAAHHPLEDCEEGPLLYPGATTTEQQYWGRISRMDARIGDIISALDAEGILEDTHIIFTSDNGPATTQTGGSSGGLRGQKSTVWEGGNRVPFLWQGPGVTAGSVDNSPRWALDWIVTMGELYGFDSTQYQTDYGSSDLLSAVGTRDLFWEFSFGQPGGDPSGRWSMLREPYKLQRYVADGSDDRFYLAADEFTQLTVGVQISAPDAASMSAALTVWQNTLPVDNTPGDPSTVTDMAEAISVLNGWYAEEVTNFSVHFIGANNEALDDLEVILNELGDLPRIHSLRWGGTLEETEITNRRGTHDTMSGPSLIMSKKEWLACFDSTKRARLTAPEISVLNTALAKAVGQRNNR